MSGLSTNELFDVFSETSAASSSLASLPVVSIATVAGKRPAAPAISTAADNDSVPPSKRLRETDEQNKFNVDLAIEADMTRQAVAAADTDKGHTDENGLLTSSSLNGSESGSVSSSSSSLPPSEDWFSRYTEQISESTDVSAGCVAEVCFPPFFDIKKYKSDKLEEKKRLETSPREPYKKYPFTLDPFQRESIQCLENDESVLVSAHTSAGKTVVAEFAIAMALARKQRVIYTSPIKALSNQKYRELFDQFKDVGLMTGDITLNPSASCLVMTTEILRNMLYRGSEIMREVAWVIFDEVHYMRNKDRGVVWEETIILLPHTVRYVFLSATIPNANEFACWIAKLHQQPCHVVYTDFRPTPLQHYLFPSNAQGLYLVVDEKGNFRDENFSKAMAVLNAANDHLGPSAELAPDGQQKKKKKRNNKETVEQDIYKIVRMIMDRQYAPVIVFSFSKKDCERYAKLMSKLDFCDAEEKKLIEQIFHNALDSLSDDDKQLDHVQDILPLLRRGVGIHHGGLLPLLKEVIEILFQEGLLKVLFSTETMGMGLNLPCKTVLFTSVRKWDGENFRVVSSGEYIQMSGRAGRRGLDDRGIVILMLDEQIDPPVAKNMIKGSADPLISAFHLSYNMLLNLLRVEDQNPLKMMARSLHQFQNSHRTPKLQQQLKAKEQDLAAVHIPDAAMVSEYHSLLQQIGKYQERVLQTIQSPSYLIPFLNAGRLVRIKNGKDDYGYGAVWAYQKKQVKAGFLIPSPNDDAKTSSSNEQSSAPTTALASSPSSSTVYLVEVLLHVTPPAQTESHPHKLGLSAVDDVPNMPPPPALDTKGTPMLVPCLLSTIAEVSTLRLVMPKEMKSREAKASAGKMLIDACNKLKKNGKPVPLLDPVKDMNIREEKFQHTLTKIEELQKRLATLPLHSADDQKEVLQRWDEKLQLESEILQLKMDLRSASADVVMHQQLKTMQVVLRRLEHTNAQNVISMKGRIAAEISTADELLTTELIFNGVFNQLPTHVCVALASALVFNEASDKDVNSQIQFLKEDLAAPYRQLLDAARRVATVMSDARMAVSAEDYLNRFQPGMMDVVYAWCLGAKFKDICKMANDIFEGSIIRCLRRLEELLRQLASAARSVGNDMLEKKFIAGIELLKRDIVFAASLYL